MRGSSNGTIYPNGCVRRISFVNFLSFESVELIPGPKLNLIIAPNGAGKSTVLCGLCLSLGGDPKLLGRSERLGDFVKCGEKIGSVEVHIWDSTKEENRIVQFYIRASNEAEYRIDGRKSSRAEVRKLAAYYGLQVDNPCVFLAQDKVKSFAEQTRELLLENTEKASSAELVKMHNEVKSYSLSGVGYTVQLESAKKRLKVVGDQLKKLEPRVQNYLQKEAMLSRLKLLRKKEAYLKCHEAQQQLMNLKEAIRVEKNALRKMFSEVDQAQTTLKSKRRAQEKYRREKDSLREQSQLIYDELRMSAQFDQLIKKISEARVRYGKVVMNLYSWEAEVEKAEMLVKEHEAKLADETKDSSLEERKGTLKLEYSELLRKENELDQQTARINNQFAQLKRDKDVIAEIRSSIEQQSAAKLEIFRMHNTRGHCADALDWYEAHKSQFKERVYIPLLSMTMNYEDSALYLESVIAPRDLMIFIFGCREDEALLTDSKHPWTISSSIISNADIARLLVEKPISEQMRAVGFQRTAFQLFTAPPVVKAYLNSVAHLSDIPIGTESTKEMFEEVCEMLRNTHHVFLAPNLKVRITTSLYRKAVSIRSDCLRNSTQYLIAHLPNRAGVGTVDDRSMQRKVEAIEQKNQALQSELEKIKRTQQEVAISKEECRKRLSEIRARERKCETIEQLLKNAQFSLKRLEVKKPDVDAALRTVIEVKAHISEKFSANFSTHTANINRFLDLQPERQCVELYYEKMKLESSALNDRISQLQEELSVKEKEIGERESEIDRASESVMETVRKWRVLTELNAISEEELNDEQKMGLDALKKEWKLNSISDDIERVKEEIVDEEAKIDVAPTDGSKEDLERQNALKAEQEDLGLKIQSANGEVNNWREKMDELLERWLNPLTELVTKINERYVLFFRRMNCAGEVHLYKPEDKYDISRYGITIMVKFNAGESLRQLSHRSQSGGERSVATMIYLMALQDLSIVPFRCVDEINQGMDPHNERRLFGTLVDLLSGSSNFSRTQYFILTPKLLRGLQYGADDVLHLINVSGDQNTSSERFIELLKRRRAERDDHMAE